MKYLKYFENNVYNDIDLLDDDEWGEPHNKSELDERNAKTVEFMNSLKVGDYLVYYWDYKPIDYSINSRTVPHLIKLTKVKRIHTDHDTNVDYPVFYFKELSKLYPDGAEDFNGWSAYVEKVVCVTRDVEEAWRVYNDFLPKLQKIRQQMLTQNKFDL